LLKNILIQII